MATRADIYQAIRNADAAGDSESVQKLGAYLKTMPADGAPSGPVTAESLKKSNPGEYDHTSPEWQAKYGPTAGQSGFQNFVAGYGKAVPDLVRGVGQRIGSVLPDSVVKAVGLPTQSDIDEMKQRDAPLMATTGGKIGSIAGKTAAALPTAFIPGANTLTGAAIIGGGQGLVEPTASNESVVGNTLFGAAGGVVGNLAGRALSSGAGYLFNKLATSRAAAQAANASKDAVTKSVTDAGYVVPPVDTNPTMLNELAGGLSGKIKTAQAASAKNQPLTNSLAAKALGLPEDTALTPSVLQQVRSDAGKAYNAVRGAGPISADTQYTKALDDIISSNTGASKSFPGMAKNPVVADIEALKQPTFDASDAVDAIKVMRDAADKASRGGDKFTAGAYKKASNALEEVIDRNLVSNGAPADVISNFRDGRQLIAKAYQVEKALNPTTGDVAASSLGNALQRGKPLSGDLLTIAQANQAFPRATQSLKQATGSVSPLDFAVSAIKGDPKALLTLGARPLVRSAVLSDALNQRLATPDYGGNSLVNLLLRGAKSDAVNKLAPYAGAQAAIGSR